MEAPKFNLSATNLDIKDDAELAAAIEKEGKRGFDVGNYTVKTTNPRYHANKETGSIFCKGDATWFNVVVTLEQDGRSKDHYIQVPTSRIKYGDKKGGTLFVFKKFVEFMSGIGETVSLNNLGKICEKYFSSEDALKKLADKELTVDFGYQGPHAAKVEDEQYVIMIKDKPLEEDGEALRFPDVASAKVFADAKGLKLSYPEIVKIHSNVKPVKTEGWD